MNFIQRFIADRRKQKLHDKVKFMLASDRSTIQKAMDRIAAASDVEVIDATDVANIVRAISPSGFEYRVDLYGADEIYGAITFSNYRKLVNGINHLEEEDEFLVALCLIDKCEEYGDYASMVRVFALFEYVVRHNRTNTPVVVFSRQYNIEMRKYLSDLGLL
jgi:hypothetical protein